MEDDDQQFESAFDDEDYGEFDDMYGGSESDQDEVIDYEDMKSALELIQNSDIVKEALDQGVDLIEYEQKIESDLSEAAKGSVSDYIDESVRLAKLHKEITTCDTLLAQMQDLLHMYQHNLSGVANEIRSLQSESVIISQKLENRRTMDGVIRGFINKVAINPNMVKVLVEGEINEEYVATLHQFNDQLDFVEEERENEDLHVKTSEVKAIKEVRNDLNILKSQCGSKVKEYALERVRKITPDVDLEKIQQEDLVGLSEIMKFLKKHITKTYEDIRKQYVSVVKDIIYNRIKTYREQLLPHEQVVGNQEDPLIHVQNIVRSFLKKKQQKSLKEYGVEGYELGDRYEILKQIEEKPISVNPLPEGDDPDLDYLVCYRSLLRMFMDIAMNEYSFIKTFFHAEDTTIFMDVFKETSKYLQAQTMEWVNNTFDYVGVMIVTMLIQSFITQLQNSEYPILIDFYLSLRDKVIARLGVILDKHVAAVKSAQSQVKTMEISESIHYAIKRYACISTSVYYLNHKYADLLLEREKWEKPMNHLTDEVIVLLEKFSEMMNEDKQTSYMFRNITFILEMMNQKEVQVENELSKLFEKYSKLYLEELMSEHMSFLYDFVRKNENKKGSQLKLSSNEMKGLKAYKEDYKDHVAIMNKVIKANVEYYGLEVYKAWIKLVSDYHTKYIQILGGTSFVKELVPVKKIVTEATKYCVEYE